jgi:uncharacterized protein YejL (UPF0352 family)
MKGEYMTKQKIINEAVQTAYTNITSIVDLDLIIVGNYVSYMIPQSILKNNPDYIDEIIDGVFWKLMNEIKSKVTRDDIEFIEFKEFLSKNPSSKLIKDCFDIVNTNLKNKKSSNEQSLFLLLKSIENNYPKEEIEKSLDTIFDILLDYYSIIRK